MIIVIMIIMLSEVVSPEKRVKKAGKAPKYSQCPCDPLFISHGLKEVSAPLFKLASNAKVIICFIEQGCANFSR